MTYKLSRMDDTMVAMPPCTVYMMAARSIPLAFALIPTGSTSHASAALESVSSAQLVVMMGWVLHEACSNGRRRPPHYFLQVHLAVSSLRIVHATRPPSHACRDLFEAQCTLLRGPSKAMPLVATLLAPHRLLLVVALLLRYRSLYSELIIRVCVVSCGC